MSDGVLSKLIGIPRQIITRVDRTMIGMVAGGVLTQLGLVVSGIVAARALGPGDRGYLASLQAIAISGSFIIAMGVPMAIAYYTARDESTARSSVRVLRSVMVWQVLACFAVTAVVVLVAFRDAPDYARLSAWISLPTTAFLMIGMYAMGYAQGLQRFLAFNLFRAVPIPVYGLVLVILVMLGQDGLVEFATTYTVIAVITASIGGILVWRWLPEGDGGSIPARKYLNFGLKGQVGSMSPLEAFQVDYLVVGALLGPYWLGLYAGAMAFTNLPRFVAQSIGALAFPRVAAARGTNHAVRSALDAVLVTSAFALVVVIGLELIIGWLIPFLFGPAFEPSVPIARVLLISALLLSVRRIVGDVMRGGGKPLPSTAAEIISWIAYAIFVVPMIHHFGAVGAAWAMAIAATTSTIYLSIRAASMLRRTKRDLEDAQS